jgi:endoglucanase
MTTVNAVLFDADGAVRRCLCVVLAAVVGMLALCGVSHAATPPGSVSLDQPAYTAHEAQGTLTITIERTGSLTGAEHVGYGVKRQDAQPGIDFDTIPNTYVTFAPGQSTVTFNVSIIDRGINSTPVHALAYLYSSYPDSLGVNNNSLITILHDDALGQRIPTNPLATTTATAAAMLTATGNVLAGTTFYVDPNSPAAKAERHYAHSDPAWAKALSDIAVQPAAHRFYMWNMGSNVAGQVSHYLEGTQVQQPGSTVMLSTYSLVHGKCGYTATPAIQARYDDFMKQVAAGIGNTHVVFFLELDSLITASCLDHHQLAIRDAELNYAISVLEADPHVVVYLDGGAADAHSASRQASYLRGAGVAHTQGFFLNSTHFDWMTTEIHYGQDISRRLGGAHFVVNSGENGRGPLHPADGVTQGNEVLCNPPGRGLGPISINNRIAQPTGYANDDPVRLTSR